MSCVFSWSIGRGSVGSSGNEGRMSSMFCDRVFNPRSLVKEYSIFVSTAWNWAIYYTLTS